MKVGILGINHKLANLKLRERLAQACQRYFTLGGLIFESHTFVLLTTCNRTEIYFASPDLASTHSFLLQILREELEDDFDQKIYCYFGQDCFLHLARVTAGLDSAIVAETEIQAQVKAAYENAAMAIKLPPELHFLFQKVLKIGKKVRTELSMGRGMPDLEHAIFNAGLHFFTKPQNTRVLFVGASDVNCKILAFLRKKQLEDITLCNRTLQRAQCIAENNQVSVLNWNCLGNWHQYDWVIFGTKASHYLVTKKDLPVSGISQKLIIDLCVPRNVEPKLGRDPRVTLLNIDQINRILKVRRQHMSHTLSAAEQMVSATSQRHVESFYAKEKNRNLFQAATA